MAEVLITQLAPSLEKDHKETRGVYCAAGFEDNIDRRYPFTVRVALCSYATCTCFVFNNVTHSLARD